jgi:hypothetical protein
MNCKIELSPRFQKDVKHLKKKYKLIKNDISLLILELKENPYSGTSLGDGVFKIRVPNSSIPTGKSGGFRAISLVKIEDEKVQLLTIYSKTDKENILEKELQEILKE